MLRFISIASAFTISQGLKIRIGPSRRAGVDSDEALSEHEDETPIPDAAVPAGGEHNISRVEPAVEVT